MFNFWRLLVFVLLTLSIGLFVAINSSPYPEVRQRAIAIR
jgi:hypothetical protein